MGLIVARSFSVLTMADVSNENVKDGSNFFIAAEDERLGKSWVDIADHPVHGETRESNQIKLPKIREAFISGPTTSSTAVRTERALQCRFGRVNKLCLKFRQCLAKACTCLDKKDCPSFVDYSKAMKIYEDFGVHRKVPFCHRGCYDILNASSSWPTSRSTPNAPE